MQTRNNIASYPVPSELESARVGRWVLFATILASSMAFIDGTALNVALPALQAGLHASGAHLLWVVNGYLLMLAALMIASFGRFKFKGKLLTFGTLVFPLTVIAFALTNSIPLSLAVLVGADWSFMTIANMANTLIQTLVTDDLRERVMGVYSLVFFGFMPVGALLAGAMAQWIGAQPTVIAGAVISLVFAIGLYLFVPKVRALE